MRLNDRNEFRSIVAVFSFVVYAGSFFSPIPSSGWLLLLKTAGFAISAVGYAGCVLSERNDSQKEQYILINFGILVFYLMLDLVAFYPMFNIRNLSALSQMIIWSFTSIVVLFIDFIYNRDSYLRFADKIRQKRYLIVGALLISSVVIVFSYDLDGPHFVWDSNLVYNHVLRETDLGSLFRLKDLVFCDHICFSFFYPVVLLSQLLNSVDIAFFVYNSFIIYLAGLGFTILFHTVITEKRTYEYLLMTAVCMVSPYIFGLSSLYIYDYATICITPVFLWTVFGKKWKLFFVSGLFICFLKEPGVVYFASVCVVILVTELVFERRALSDAVRDVKYWGAFFVVLVFSVNYFVYGNYGSKTGESFGFDENKIVETIKSFCILNYSWALTLLSLAMIVFVFFKKNKDRQMQQQVVIIAVPSAIFLLTNCFITSPTNPRYIDFFYPGILILSVLLIMMIDIERILKGIAFIILGAVFLGACYNSFDPLSNLIFPKVDIGTTKLCSTHGSKFCDLTVYNRQYYGFDIALSRALMKGIDNNDEIVSISTGTDHGNWSMSGKWTYDYENEVYDYDEYWDVKKGMRAPGYAWNQDADPRYKSIRVKYIFPEQDPVLELPDNRSFIYIYMPSQNDGKEEEIRSSCSVTEEGTCVCRGWKVSFIRGIK